LAKMSNVLRIGDEPRSDPHQRHACNAQGIHSGRCLHTPQHIANQPCVGGSVGGAVAVLRRGACIQAARGREAHRVRVEVRGCRRNRSNCEGGVVPPSHPGAQNGHRSAPADTDSNAAWCATVAGSVTGARGLTSDAKGTHGGTKQARQTCRNGSTSTSVMPKRALSELKHGPHVDGGGRRRVSCLHFMLLKSTVQEMRSSSSPGRKKGCISSRVFWGAVDAPCAEHSARVREKER
jgi:hypothetical protein